MKLSTKIKLEYWQAVTTGKPHGNLDAMLTEALDKMEEELDKLKETNSPVGRTHYETTKRNI